MTSDYHTATLSETLGRLGDSPVMAGAVAHLTAHAAAINSDLRDTILSEIPAFSDSGNPDVLPQFAGHGPRHTSEIIRLLAGGRVGEFEFVRDHARRRAEQRFPLEAVLHAYRCGHKVFSRWLREAVLATESTSRRAQQAIAGIADFAIEYTDTISTIAASAYVSQIRLLADLAGDQRAELLSILLEGYDESDGRVAKILRDAGYLDQRQCFCVALARPVDPAEMLNISRARRLADAIDETLRASRVRRLIDIRDNKVTIVLSDTRRASGWTEPNTSLAKRMAAELTLVGNAALIGISNDVPSTSQIPSAHQEALLALDFSDVTHRVVQLSDIPTRRLMLHLAGAKFHRVLPHWTRPFFTADDKAGGALIATLRAYANADMNVLKAAESLAVHPNTIYSRLQKIRDLTGLEGRSYHGLSELLMVADCGDDLPAGVVTNPRDKRLQRPKSGR